MGGGGGGGDVPCVAEVVNRSLKADCTNFNLLADDIILDETLDKERNSLLQFATLERLKGHLLWLLVQSYIDTAFPLNI